MFKYSRLKQFLERQESPEWVASFSEVEKVLGFSLPESARRHRPWWANQSGMKHSQTKGWMAAGWCTADVSLESERVTFVRRTPQSRTSLATVASIEHKQDTASTALKGLSIAEAKQAIAQYYDTSPGNIEILIRG